jgi:hypothetical protein
MRAEEDDAEKREFIRNGMPQRTEKATQNSWSCFLRWANELTLNNDWSTMEPSTFALHLERFIMEVKKTDGSEYKNSFNKSNYFRAFQMEARKYNLSERRLQLPRVR